MSEIINQLGQALVNADRAGDTNAARLLAAELDRLMRQSQKPAPAPQGPPQEDIERAASLRREAATLPPMRADVRPSEEAAMLAAQRERTTALGQAQLLEKGIRIGEAPLEARIRSGLGLNRLQGYRSVLGPEFDVEEVTTEGPYKGEIIFRRKGEQQWQTVRQPEGFVQQPFDVGARARDILSVRETAIPEIAGAIGGAAGASIRTSIPGLRSPVATAVAGSALARLWPEYYRLSRGREQGIVPKDVSDADLFVAAINETWPQALGEGAGVALYSMMRFGAARGMPDLSGVTPNQFEAAVQEARQRAGQAGQKTLSVGDIFAVMADPQFAQRIGVSPNTAQSLASFFKTAEDKISSTVRIPQQRQFQERALERERIASESLQRELPEGAAPVTQDIRQMGEAVERAAPGVEEAQSMLRAVAPTSPTSVQDLGERVTATLRKAEQGEKDVVQRVYQRIGADAAGATQTADNTIKLLDEFGSEFETRIFPSLTEDNRRLVKEGLSRLTTEVPAADPTQPATRTAVEVNFDQYQKAISDIRRAIRNSYKGDWSGEIDQLAKIEESLIVDRDALLRRTGGGQQSIDDLNAADAEWAQLKNTFRRAKVADAFKINPKMSRAETAEDFLDSVSMNADTARALMPYLQPRERQEIRGMLTLQLSELARSYGRGREIRQPTLEKAINSPDSAVGVFFSPAERAQLTNAARLQDVRRKIGIPDNGRLEDWFDGFYKAKSITQAETVFRRLGMDPANAPVADAIRGMMRKNLYDDITKEGPQKGRILDIEKFTDMMRDPKQAQWLVATLGPSFAARMRVVQEATQTMFPNVPRINMGDEPAATGKIELVNRAMRAVVGVLSPESRALTFAMQTARGEVRDRIARAILDPEYFQMVMQRSQNTARGRMTAGAIGGVLAEEDLGDTSGDTWASDLPVKWSNNIGNMMGARQ